jgi:hypothetical protein
MLRDKVRVEVVDATEEVWEIFHPPISTSQSSNFK